MDRYESKRREGIVTLSKRKLNSLSKTKKIIIAVSLTFATSSIVSGMLISKAASNLKEITPTATTILYDDAGTEIGTIHAVEDRRPVKLSQIPKDLQNAFIATEDNRFYQHHGVDLKGIARALYTNITGNQVAEGGSTITQQLAKNAYLTQERTITRKIQEAMLAVFLEYKYSKDEILEMYLNQIYFGRGAYGVEVAAQTYFNKDVKDLDLNECAMLAGIPKSPNYFSPLNNYQAAMDRKVVVLDQMQKYNYISPTTANELKKTDLVLKKEEKESKFASYFINYVTEKLVEAYGEDAVFKKGLKVYTTLNSNMQKLGEQQIQGIYISRSGKVAQPQGALVSIEPKTGKIKAMVGGRGTDDFNRATLAERQPGSSFKPFVFVTALMKGYTPDSIIQDSPISFGGWSPQNYGRSFSGAVTMRTVAIRSLNVPTIKLANDIGIENVLDTATKLGITSFVETDKTLPASIGGLTNGVIPLDMATAYATFANDGIKNSPICFDKVIDINSNKELTLPIQEQTRVIDSENNRLLTSMLKDVVTRGTGTHANIGRDAAGKTGTTDNYKDAWFCGYTPDLATVVWLGNDDGVSLPGITGGNLPAEIWGRYMRRALDNVSASSFEKAEPKEENIEHKSSEPVKDDEKHETPKEEKKIESNISSGSTSQQQNAYKQSVREERHEQPAPPQRVPEQPRREQPQPTPAQVPMTPGENISKRR